MEDAFAYKLCMDEIRVENNSESESPTENATAPERVPTLDLQKLRRLRKGLRLTQAELATLLGIHRTYLVLIEKGKKIPSPRLERSILDFMEKAENQSISPQTVWTQLNDHSNTSRLVSEAPVRRAPSVTWAAAGQAQSYDDIVAKFDETVETECRDPKSFAIILEGDSMEPKFYAGDRVVCAPSSEPRNGDAVIAKLQDGRLMFKYFFRTGPEGARVKLLSENPNYGSLEFDRSDFLFLYPGWEVKRRLRR
jgi:phage repressor protein C with HTH and peptisase S24 domain